MRVVTAYIIGLLFGIGILLSGMANPAKVLAFFDIAAAWDPSLAFVMGGALGVTALGYRLVLRRSGPIFEADYELPSATNITPSLVIGALIFGIGWGLVGFCPGGVLPALGTGRSEVLVFVGSLLFGMVLTRWLKAKLLASSRVLNSVQKLI